MANELDEITDTEPSASDDCGCGKQQAAAAADLTPERALADVESALSELAVSAPGNELDIGALEDALELGPSAEEPAVALEDLLSLAERYPGLKITFSF